MSVPKKIIRLPEEGATNVGKGSAAKWFARFSGIVQSEPFKTLKQNEAKLLMVYLMHADNETGRCFPGLERLAALTGIGSTANVSAARRGLERKQFIRVIAKGGGYASKNKGRPTHVQVTVPGNTVGDNRERNGGLCRIRDRDSVEMREEGSVGTAKHSVPLNRGTANTKLLKRRITQHNSDACRVGVVGGDEGAVRDERDVRGSVLQELEGFGIDAGPSIVKRLGLGWGQQAVLHIHRYHRQHRDDQDYVKPRYARMVVKKGFEFEFGTEIAEDEDGFFIELDADEWQKELKNAKASARRRRTCEADFMGDSVNAMNPPNWKEHYEPGPGEPGHRIQLDEYECG
jgi:hypothetical protein